MHADTPLSKAPCYMLLLVIFFRQHVRPSPPNAVELTVTMDSTCTPQIKIGNLRHLRSKIFFGSTELKKMNHILFVELEISIWFWTSQEDFCQQRFYIIVILWIILALSAHEITLIDNIIITGYLRKKLVSGHFLHWNAHLPNGLLDKTSSWTNESPSARTRSSVGSWPWALRWGAKLNRPNKHRNINFLPEKTWVEWRMPQKH